MTRKFLTVFVALLFLLPVLSIAQSQVLLHPSGEMIKVDQADGDEVINMPEIPAKLLRDKNLVKSYKNPSNIMAAGTIDTLDNRELGGTWNSNFGFEGQDYLIQWFVAPADMDILSCGFAPSEPDLTDDRSVNIELKIIGIQWTEQEVRDATAAATYLGYYEATDNGKHDITALWNNLDRTGDWVDVAGNAATSPFAETVDDIWSDGGLGYPFTITGGEGGMVPDYPAYTYYWANMIDLGFNPSVTEGTVFGVVLYNVGGTVGDATRAAAWASASLAFGGFKYYADGRLVTGADGDYGWWGREYAWDIVVAVDLTGDRAPAISEVTQLITTVSTESRTVDATITDDNPSGGPAGVAAAYINYTTDGGETYSQVAMTGTEPNYTGVIPGMPVGTELTYYVSADDVEGKTGVSEPVTYSIFLPVEQVLWVYDFDAGYSLGTMDYYYWASVNDSIYAHDIWEAPYGTVSDELLENYQIVYHVMGDGPNGSGLDIGLIYKDWLDGATAEVPRRLFISGQDYGVISAFNDTTFSPGTFEYDYLGVETLGPQDINYDGSEASYQNAYAVDGTESPLTAEYADFEGDSLQLYYWPYDEWGWSNWIDNLTPTESAVVDWTDPNQSDAAVGVHNEGENWKTVFWTLDPICLAYYSPDDTSSSYHWILNVGNGNPLVNVLNWFESPVTAIEDGDVITARAYHLKQNYPNPFNPTTTIEYSIPSKAKVTLKIFDIQGREVATLVDNNIDAGSHTVNFDASSYATGIYFYQLTTSENQALVKKMMFIK